MPLITTLQEELERFEKEFGNDQWDCSYEEVQSFLTQSHIRLLKSLKEELPKEDKTKYCGAKEHEDGTVCTSCENGLSNCDRVEAARQHNNLLSTTHQLIDNAIKSIEV